MQQPWDFQHQFLTGKLDGHNSGSKTDSKAEKITKDIQDLRLPPMATSQSINMIKPSGLQEVPSPKPPVLLGRPVQPLSDLQKQHTLSRQGPSAGEVERPSDDREKLRRLQENCRNLVRDNEQLRA